MKLHSSWLALAVLATFALALAGFTVPDLAHAGMPPDPVCGNNVLEGGEVCDGTDDACFGTERPFDTQILPDGTTQPFTIPAGQVLVLTGTSWFHANVGTDVSVVQELLLRRPSGPEVIWRSHAQSVPTGGGYAGQHSIIPQVVVAPGPALCISEFINNGAVASGPATLHGFLAKDN